MPTGLQNCVAAEQSWVGSIPICFRQKNVMTSRRELGMNIPYKQSIEEL